LKTHHRFERLWLRGAFPAPATSFMTVSVPLQALASVKLRLVCAPFLVVAGHEGDVLQVDLTPV